MTAALSPSCCKLWSHFLIFNRQAVSFSSVSLVSLLPFGVYNGCRCALLCQQLWLLRLLFFGIYNNNGQMLIYNYKRCDAISGIPSCFTSFYGTNRWCEYVLLRNKRVLQKPGRMTVYSANVVFRAGPSQVIVPRAWDLLQSLNNIAGGHSENVFGIFF